MRAVQEAAAARQVSVRPVGLRARMAAAAAAEAEAEARYQARYAAMKAIPAARVRAWLRRWSWLDLDLGPCARCGRYGQLPCACGPDAITSDKRNYQTLS